MTTITKTAPAKSKLAHTYSRLKSFETCPRKYYECDVLKKWPEPPSEHLQWGDAVHQAMANGLKHGKELPLAMQGYQKWVDKVNSVHGLLLVEDDSRLAINRDMQPCAWFSPQAWMRCIADVIKLDEEFPGIALAVDWKTGKSSNVDEVQLTVISLMLFIHYPSIMRVRADFIYLQDDAQCTMVMDRKETADQWAELLPRLNKLEQAHEIGNFPPSPNNFCRAWCGVKTCEYNGKR